MEQRNEFASHEFNSYEFGIESVALLRPTDLISESSGSYQGFVNAISNTSLNGLPVDVQLTGVMQAIQNMVGNASGNSEVAGHGQAITPTLVSVVNVSTEEFLSGFAQGVSFSSNGEATVTFFYMEGDEFHSRNNKALVLFFSGSTANTAGNISSDSAVLFNGSGVIRTSTDISGGSLATLVAQGVNTSYGRFAGVSEGNFVSQAIKNALYEASGIGTVSGKGQKVVLTVHNINGSVATQLVGFAVTKQDTRMLSNSSSFGYFSENSYQKVDTDIRGQGSAIFTGLGTEVRLTNLVSSGIGVMDFVPGEVSFFEFGSNGTCTTLFLRGRNTLPFLDPSYFVTIRPYEHRATEWKP